MKSSIFNSLLIALAVLIFGLWLQTLPNRPVRQDRTVALHYRPLPVPGTGIAEWWEVKAADPRFGGVSGLAMQNGHLIAITDSGTVLIFDSPDRAGAQVRVHDLPAVAGRPDRKNGRDAEAVVRDANGRGWWVAFEQRHSVLHYDAEFTRLLERRAISNDLPPNRGVEALYLDRRGRLTGLAEASGVSDAARLPDGRLALLERIVGLAGLRSRVIARGVDLALPLGRLDNPEAMTAERRVDGSTRLWIMTDNDFRSGQPTLLIAIDLPPA